MCICARLTVCKKHYHVLTVCVCVSQSLVELCHCVSMCVVCVCVCVSTCVCVCVWARDGVGSKELWESKAINICSWLAAIAGHSVRRCWGVCVCVCVLQRKWERVRERWKKREGGRDDSTVSRQGMREASYIDWNSITLGWVLPTALPFSISHFIKYSFRRRRACRAQDRVL